MTKSRIFFWTALAFVGGISAGSFLNFSLEIHSLAALILGVSLLAVFYREKKVMVFSLVLIFLATGVWRSELAQKRIELLGNSPDDFSGPVRIIKEPEDKGNYLRVTGEILEGEKEGVRIIFNEGSYSELSYGDDLDISCKLKIPENRDERFDYRMYLAKDGIYYECEKPGIKKVNHGRGSILFQKLLLVKNRLSKNIDSVIPYPESVLAKGIIFGGSSGLPKQLSDNFSRTGMTHIVAVSGYNVTIIAEYLILLGIFLGLWRNQAFWFAVAGIFIFVAMIGFPASAVRAGVMGGVLLWAMKHGRLANSTNALLLAAAIMLMLNPLLLRHDVGFQLSFLATMGIVWFAPLFEKYVSPKFNFLDWQGIILLTLSAQFFVTPVILYNFGRISFVSLLANLLILPTIPLSMLLVFAVSVAGLFFSYLSLVLAWVAFLPLKYEVMLINYLGEWEWASAETDPIHWGWIFGWYLVLFSATFILRRRKKELKQENGKQEY